MPSPEWKGATRPEHEISPEEIAFHARLLEKVGAHVAIADDDAVLLQGSIAEGFGNATSDFDILIVTPREDGVAEHRRHLVVEGRRVEVWKRSVRMQAALAQTIEAAFRNEDRETPIDALHEYQQFCNARVLRRSPGLAALKDRFSLEVVRDLATRRSRAIARKAFARARVLEALDAADPARRHLALAATHAAKVVAAKAGETYVKEKSVELQLRRAGLHAPLALLRGVLHGPASAGGDLCRDLLRQAGVTLDDLEARSPMAWTARLSAQVEPFEVGGALHLLAPGRVMTLSAPAREIVVSLARGPRRLDALFARPSGVQALENLHRYGAVSLVPPDGGAPWARRDTPPALAADAVMVSPLGVSQGPLEGDHVAILPMTERQFAGAGAEVTWSFVVMDHCDEDVVGATRAAQWCLVEHGLRRWALAFAQGWLSALGRALPDVEDVWGALRRDPRAPSDLVTAAIDLLTAEVRNVDDAVAGRRRAETLRDSFLSILGCEGVDLTHEAIMHRQDAAAIGSAWIDLITRLGVETSIIHGAVFAPPNQQGVAA